MFLTFDIKEGSKKGVYAQFFPILKENVFFCLG